MITKETVNGGQIGQHSLCIVTTKGRTGRIGKWFIYTRIAANVGVNSITWTLIKYNKFLGPLNKDFLAKTQQNSSTKVFYTAFDWIGLLSSLQLSMLWGFFCGMQVKLPGLYMWLRFSLFRAELHRAETHTLRLGHAEMITTLTLKLHASTLKSNW